MNKWLYSEHVNRQGWREAEGISARVCRLVISEVLLSMAKKDAFATRPSLSPGTCFSVAWCKWSGFPAGDEEKWCSVAFDLVSCHHALMLVLHERCWSKPLSSHIVCTPPSLSSRHLPAFTCKSHRLNNYMQRCTYGSKWGEYYRSLQSNVEKIIEVTNNNNNRLSGMKCITVSRMWRFPTHIRSHTSHLDAWLEVLTSFS